jgi:nucleotidyltransferase substrate binding protein (TIGR01987 family)
MYSIGESVNEKKLHLASIKKAYVTFIRFSEHLDTDQNKAGAVQAFEFCYELCWKFMKRALAQNGVEASSPRDVFRKAALNKLIDDPEIWFEFLERRNITSHTYEEANLELIVEILPSFGKQMAILIERLERSTDNFLNH